jgi:hypothetical protein
LILFLPSNSVFADVVFSENFDDADLEGWVATGININFTDPSTSVFTDPEFSITSGVLDMGGPDPIYDDTGIQLKSVHYNFISHGYFLDEGWKPGPTHSADFVGISSNTFVQSDFVTGNPSEFTEFSSYELRMDVQQSVAFRSITLVKYLNNGLNPIELKKYAIPSSFNINDWFTIEITRDIKGQFRVYLDQDEIIEFTDTDITDINSFYIQATPGSQFDNVEISLEEPDETKTSENSFPIGIMILIFGTYVILKVIIRKRNITI